MIVGPMFSGKSTELFRHMNRYELAGKKTVLVKYAKDDRYDSEMASTHDKRKMKALKAIRLCEVIDTIQDYQVIGVDEGQFFDDIVTYAEALANMGKTVIIAALDGDFRREPFPTITRLYALAEKVDKLSAVCRKCSYFASFTARTKPLDEVEVIGGVEMYEAMCRKCYNEAREKLYVENVPEGSGSSVSKRVAEDAINPSGVAIKRRNA
uniref:Thymidine kinase n=1 Tax=Steinernema glaseri TaxID=37863 RepID=A0A1I7YBT0_9BILA